jgi:hypothetical protein
MQLKVFAPNKIHQMTYLIFLYVFLLVKCLIYKKQIIPIPNMMSSDLIKGKEYGSSQGISIKTILAK